MEHVLFVCTHNAGRSQIAQALFEQAADGRHAAASAGTAPADRVHPEVLAVMRELGIDLADRKPQPLTPQLAEQADVVVTMGCGDQCPFIPGKRYIDWSWTTPRAGPSKKFARSAMRLRAASPSFSPSSTPEKLHRPRRGNRASAGLKR